jgi:hypothetical protein
MVRTPREIIAERRPIHDLYLSQRAVEQVVTASTYPIGHAEYQ